MGLFDKLKSESKEAAYRVAGTQLLKAAKHSLLTVLRNRNVENKYLESVSNFLDTEIGTAVLSTIVGFVLTNFPAFKQDKRAQSIAKEFRVGGISLIGNLLADKAMGSLLPEMSRILKLLPDGGNKSSGLRLEDLTNSLFPSFEEQVQDTETKQLKRSV